MAIDEPPSTPDLRIAAGVPVRPETAATTLAIAAVALGYYLAARLGMELRFPHSTPSVLWPPNALLTATLLLTAPRRWWIYLLAAFPAHLIVELHTGWPPLMVVGLFLTNCCEALLAAGGVLWLTRAPGRFDTVSRTVSFLVAAVVGATFLSSFPDAAVVWQVRGEPFWTVFRTRFFSNALAALTIVPAVVLTVRQGADRLRNASTRRKIEAGLLAACVVVGGFLAFASPASGLRGEIDPVHDPLLLSIPILMWAAVRFGPMGLSLTLLFTTVIAIGGGMQERGPFSILAPETGVLALQLFLCSAGIPLLVLASASQERRQALVALKERLRFEKLISALTLALAQLPLDRADEAIRLLLARLCDFFGAHRGLLLLHEPAAAEIAVAHQWHRPGLDPLAPGIAITYLPRIASSLARGESVVVESLDGAGLSASAAGADDADDADGSDRTWLRRAGAESAIFAPLDGAGRRLGALALLRPGRSRWQGGEPRARLVAELFAGALVRLEAEAGRQAAEDLEQGLLSSLPHQVAILDRDGRILSVNGRWTRLTSASSSPALVVGAAGDDYFAACRQVTDVGGLQGTEAEAGVRSVLGGRLAGFSCEYVWRSPVGERWFAMSVAPLERAEGGAIVSHTDITLLKESAAELAASRQELAHFNRLATMGELTASLAHELNQPLTAILLKAQTAQRLLAAQAASAGELPPLLDDLVDDARRATGVVRRSRELLSKQGTEGLLDFHQEIHGVARLLAADARRRRVALTVELAGGRAMVHGDRLQLQQVLLNLLLNAFDASAGLPAAAVSVRSALLRSELEVTVSDSGAGIAPGVEARLFEPFVTTKPQGMGLGLSICRTILYTHGGSIRASNNSGAGATFRFLLPLALALEPDGPPQAEHSA